jgi:hypothetical protein
VGDSGSGKSALAKDYASAHCRRTVWLNGATLEYDSYADFEKSSGLHHDIAEVVNGSPERAVFVFDAFEGFSPRAQRVGLQILRKLTEATPSGRVHIILTTQTEAAPAIVQELAASSLPRSLLDPTLVPRPTETHIRKLVVGIPKVRGVTLRPELRSLLTNLKMLDWFVQSIEAGAAIDSSAVMGLTTLIDSLWVHWVESGADKFAKSALLMRVASLEADKPFCT